MLSTAAIRAELAPMLRLALPLIVAELGWMAMEIVDTIMVSRLPNSTEAIGAAGLGGILFYVASIFAAGLLFGLDTVVSQSFGAGRLDECHRWLIQSLYIVAALTPFVMLATWATPHALALTGTLDPSLLSETRRYMHALMWSALPLLLYFAFRRYLQAINHVGIVMASLVAANLVNVVANYALIFGNLGAPAMGIAGAGWGTVIARSTMAVVLLGYIVWYDRQHHVSILDILRGHHDEVSASSSSAARAEKVSSFRFQVSGENQEQDQDHSKPGTRNSKPGLEPSAFISVHQRPSGFPGLRPDMSRLGTLLRLGFPVAFQILFEVGVFAAATYMAGRLGVIPLAAHQITLRTASVTFMVPLAISSAAAVRVGQALGRGDPPGAARAGWTALALGAAFMTCAALVFVSVPQQIARIFTQDAGVIATTISLLLVAAVFQLCDGLQIVASGALRGAGDTRTPMLTSLAAYWGLGLPLGAYLGLWAGMGVVGVWTGLCVALCGIGAGLLWWWGKAVSRFTFHVSR